MIKENRYFDEQVKSLIFEKNGESLSVGVMEKGESSFDVKVEQPTAYLCEYIK